MASVGASNPVEAAASAAEAARSRITTTIDDIQYRLDPRRMVSDAVDRVQTGSRTIASQAGDVAKSHPVAIGAAIAALGLALLARNRLSHATINMADSGNDYTDYDDGYGEAVAYSDPAPSGQTLVGDVRTSNVASPGISIVVGLIAGAIVGALLPVSETERLTLGDAGSRLGAAAKAAARAAAGELDAAGISVDSVRAKASEAGHKARNVAHNVMDAARAELHG